MLLPKLSTTTKRLLSSMKPFEAEIAEVSSKNEKSPKISIQGSSKAKTWTKTKKKHRKQRTATIEEYEVE